MKETIGRQRTRFAYDRVVSWGSGLRKNAEARVKSLPVQVRTQGLGTALATLIHQDKIETRELADLLAEWLLRDSPRKPLAETSNGESGRRDLLDAVVRADRPSFIAAQHEAIALLDEVKTLTQALVAGEDHCG